MKVYIVDAVHYTTEGQDWRWRPRVYADHDAATRWVASLPVAFKLAVSVHGRGNGERIKEAMRQLDPGFMFDVDWFADEGARLDDEFPDYDISEEEVLAS